MRLSANKRILYLSSDDTYNWANKSGAKWPCSTLSGRRVKVYLAGGIEWEVDIVYIDGKSQHEDIHTDQYELKCFLDDMIAKARRKYLKVDRRKPWKYRGCTIEPEGGEHTYFGHPKNHPGSTRWPLWYVRWWKIWFPDKTWIKCSTKERCREYIDKWQEKYNGPLSPTYK